MIDVVHICVAMKPIDGNFAGNAIEHGVAGLNVDGCRVCTDDNLNGGTYSQPSGKQQIRAGDLRSGKSLGSYDSNNKAHGEFQQPQGRWPANIIHDGSTEIKERFPDSNGGAYPSKGAGFGYSGGERKQNGKRTEMNDEGSAARFFYQVRKR